MFEAHFNARPTLQDTIVLDFSAGLCFCLVIVRCRRSSAWLEHESYNQHEWRPFCRMARL